MNVSVYVCVYLVVCIRPHHQGHELPLDLLPEPHRRVEEALVRVPLEAAGGDVGHQEHLK